MRRVLSLLPLIALFSLAAIPVQAQLPVCPDRPKPGTVVQNPVDLYSQNGVLKVDLTMQNALGLDGLIHYCYAYMYQGKLIEAPTLRVNPGDQLILNLTNNLQAPFGPTQLLKKKHVEVPMHMHAVHKAGAQDDPCDGTMILPSSTNLHFHGMNVPPTCHQDEVVYTIIQSGDPTFQFNVQIPSNDSPGMYWYHPHPHGYSFSQVLGGASGALIIEGSNPLTDGLTEHVLIIRKNPPPPGYSEDAQNYLTLNFQPSTPPLDPVPIINVEPGKKEFWRVLNASPEQFMQLQIKYGDTLQSVEMIAIDGVPLQTPTDYTTVIIPPAGRAEFITPPLPQGVHGNWQTLGYDTGPIGDTDVPQLIAKIEPISGLSPAKRAPHPAAHRPAPARFAGLKQQTPTAQRGLYFSETTSGTNGPFQLFITLQGQTPHVFHMDDPPAITTHVGAVEDWTIENRSGEAHAFHIHQIHFLVMAINGVPVPDPYLADTIPVVSWSGSGPYPSVTLRMDFRDPEIAGTFVYHCHILDHEDGGMMAKILVLPAQ